MDNRLRLYETKSDYLNDANSLTYPTVSFIEENKSFKKKERSYLFATYKVTDTSAAITLLGGRFDISQISAMYIDGERISSPVATYTFSTLGQHTVKMVIKSTLTKYDNMFNGCVNLVIADCDNLIVDNVNSFKNMFASCTMLQTVAMSQDISNIVIADITSISQMFENANPNIKIIHNGACDEMWELVKRQSFALETAIFEPELVINDDECDHITVRTSVLSDMSNVKCVNDKKRIVKMSIDGETIIPNTNFVLTRGKTHNVKMSFPKSLKISDMSSLFVNCTKIRHIDLSEYKSSNITNLNYLCSGCTNLYTVNLSGLDISKGASTSSMFNGCQDLGHLVYFHKTPNQCKRIGYDLGLTNIASIDFTEYDASNVTSLSGLCSGCTNVSMVAFPKDINTTACTNMSYMFYNCSGLTAMDLSNLNTSKVTNISYLFYGCKSLKAVKMTCDVSKVTNTSSMFGNVTTTGKLYYSKKYTNTNTIINNKPSNWTDVDLNCAPEFTGTYKGNSGGTATPIFGADFDLSQVKEVYIGDTKQSTVASAYTFSSSGSNTVRCVLYADKFTDASFMFKRCTAITELNVDKLDTSNVIDMNSMFADCSGLTSASTLDISSFDTSKVTDMGYMFKCMGGKIIFPQNFGSKVTNMSYMFAGAAGTPVTRNIDLKTFNTQNVVNFANFIYDAKTLSSVTINYLNTSAATNMSCMFACLNVATNNRPLASLNTKYFDTSNVTNMSNMFEADDKLTSLDLSHFDTSNVTNMYGMFAECSGLTSLDLSSFDTSNVTYLASMFDGCTKLTSLDLSNFDTSNVTTMQFMFDGCTKFTSLDLSNFNTSKATDMSNMFSYCSGLTSLDLSHFDTSNVTNMSSMFYNCRGLTSLDLSNFDTSKVTAMNGMFNCCTNLTSLDLSNFNTSNATDMGGMFSNCKSLTSMIQVIGFDKLNTSNVTDMSGMFSICSGLTSLDLSSFDTSNVTDMGSMFSGCTNLTSIDLSSFNTSNVTDMSHMFHYCSGLTSIDLSSFDTSNVTTMYSMFCYCKNLTSVITNSNINNLTNVTNIFSDITTEGRFIYDETQDYNLILDALPPLWNGNVIIATYTISTTGSTFINNNTSILRGMVVDGTFTSASTTYSFSTTGQHVIKYNVKFSNISMASMFRGCGTLISLDFSSFNTSNVTSMSGLCSGCTVLTSVTFGEDCDTSNVTDMSSMFEFCKSLTSLDLSSFDTSKVTNMSLMFASCSLLTSLDLSSFDTSKVTDMSWMFYFCSSLTSLDVSNFNTSKVTNIGGMFNNCHSLTSLDLSNFNTSNVTNMNHMFEYCSLTSLNVSSFDTSNVTDMNGMFYGFNNLTSLDVSNFNTSKVTDMSSMFEYCRSLTSLDLSSFDTSNVTSMSKMFYKSSGLTSVTFGSQADVSKVTNYEYMFYDVNTTGTLYYPSVYANAWNNIIVTNQSTSNFPSTWTATAIDY